MDERREIETPANIEFLASFCQNTLLCAQNSLTAWPKWLYFLMNLLAILQEYKLYVYFFSILVCRAARSAPRLFA
jgi:hypothetical protein